LRVEAPDVAADAWIIALVSAFFFGLALVLTQFGLRSMAAIQGAAVSIPVSAVLCWGVAPFAVDFGGWDSGAAAIFAAVGLFFPATVTILTFEANRRMGPAVAGAVGNLAPLFAVLIAVTALGEALTPTMGLGVAAVVAGVVMMSLGRRNGARGWPVWALALPLLAALIRGAVQPVVKLALATWNSPFAAVAIGYAVSAAVVLGVAAVRSRGTSGAFNRHGVASFAAVGVCNVAAVFTLYAALARGPVTLVSPVVASYPLVTLAVGWVLLHGARPGPSVLLAVAATVAGIVLLLVGA
jgi:drug/metabolite transporter (DMT)-like permease